MSGSITICHISFNHQPFDDRIYWKEALTLKEAGYNVVHITVADKNDDFYTKDGIRIILVKRIKFVENIYVNRVLQILFRKKGTINKIFRIASALNASVFHYHDLQVNAITKKLRQLPQTPKVIYDTHEAYHLLLKQQDAPGVLSFMLNKTFAFFIKKWELIQVANCHYIITTDEYTLKYFDKKLPHIPKCIVYNYSYFIPDNGNSPKREKYDFIYSGMLSKKRGIIESILALKECKVTFPKIKLLLIGYFDKEDLNAELNYLIETNDLSQNIHIKQGVPFSEIGQYYKKSKIGICLLYNTPKYSTAIPIKLFEYMAFGLPVIFSNHGPSAEIITSTNCGLLVDYTDVAMICNSMKRLLTDIQLYQKCSKNGKQAIKEKYNWQLEKKKLIHIYDQLLALDEKK